MEKIIWKADKRKVKDLKPFPNNPRRGTKDQEERLRASLEKFGTAEPLVVNTDGVVIGGNFRKSILVKMGIKEVDVMIPSRPLNEQEALELNLRLNRNTAEWDFDILSGFDENLLKEIGFEDIVEFPDETQEATDQDDEIPEAPEPVTKKGDLWLLGKHRLLCGDSTKAEDFEQLMNGKKADLVFTDPPYGACITGFMQDVHAVNGSRHWDMIEGDQFENEELQEFLEKCFKNISNNAKDHAAWYVWHAMMTQGFFAAAAAAAAALILNRQIIWVKPCLILAFGHYHWRHELCFYGWKKGFMPKFYGEKNETTVWEIDFDGKGRIPSAEREHPTQKPVALGIRAIKNSTKKGEVVLDGFLGSGSTIIACEKTNRICYGLEIDPHYCDVIVGRWERFTGQKATRETNSRGKG
jgi:DNA modification methylase